MKTTYENELERSQARADRAARQAAHNQRYGALAVRWCWAVGAVLMFVGKIRGNRGDLLVGFMFLAIPLIRMMAGASQRRRSESLASKFSRESAVAPMRPLTCPINLAQDEIAVGVYGCKLITTQRDATTASLTSFGGLGGFGGFLGTAASKGVSRQRDSLRRADAGDLILTTQRVVFMGVTRHRIVKLADILRWQVYTDALEVREAKDGAQPLVFAMTVRTAQEAAAFLNRLRKGERPLALG